MVDEQLAFVSATELLELIATKQVSPVELTELSFRRIDRLDGQLNSFLQLTYDEAMKTAKAAEGAVVRGDQLGPLHGLPISIKDTQMTKGVRTTFGALVFKDLIPERDAAVVESVRDAGAIMSGKTNVPAGFSSGGLPIGLHIVGRKGGEEMVLAASASFEAARPWIQHRPPVSDDCVQRQ